MEIVVKKMKTQNMELDSNRLKATGMYIVYENNKEFKIVCCFDDFSSTISLAYKKGTLHINNETNQVVRQVVELSGAC